MKPNILLVHWHDVGRHLGVYGAGPITPHLDRLAAESVVFDEAYCTTPLCSPARSSLMTGRYPHANGMMGLSHLGWEYHEGERTIAHLLGEAGYRTALVGLQHESSDPARLGYQEVHAIGHGFGPAQRCGPVTERAVDWLHGHDSDQPFFLTVGFWETHRPYPAAHYPPDDPAALTVPSFLPDNAWSRDDLAAFHGSIRTADASMGDLLAALPENTWVVFTTDHGMAFPRAKSTLYGPGIGVALIMRLPGRTAGRTDRLFSHVDFLPTVLEVVGAPVPETVQGVSHARFLLEGDESPSREVVFSEKNFHDVYDPMRGVRTEQWSYVRSYEERPLLTLPGDIAGGATVWGYGSDHLRHRPAEELYDLRADPLERVNLAGDPAHEAVRQELAGLLDRWRRESGDPLLDGPIEQVPVPPHPQLGALPRTP